eukprot:gene6459-13051_t
MIKFFFCLIIMRCINSFPSVFNVFPPKIMSHNMGLDIQEINLPLEKDPSTYERKLKELIPEALLLRWYISRVENNQGKCWKNKFSNIFRSSYHKIVYLEVPFCVKNYDATLLNGPNPRLCDKMAQSYDE